MNKSKILTGFFAFVMIFLMGFGLINPIIASANAQSDFNDAQQKLNEINNEIAGLKDQKKKQQAQKDNAKTQINLVKSQISALNKDISETNTRLAEKQQQLEQKKVDIRWADQLFKDRLKAMYIMRSGGTLSTVLAVDSFSELLTATDTLQRISVADTELLKYLDEEKKAIEAEEAAIQEELNNLVTKQGTLENKQSELAGYMQTLDTQLSETAAQQKAAEETQAEVYAEYLAAKQALEAEFASSGNTSYVGGEWIWPVPSNNHISSPFGWRTLYGKADNHIGIDISTGSGTWIYNKPIVASNSGTVIKAVNGIYGYGRYIIIDHGGNNFTLYGHCNSLAVNVGDYVTQGQTIAYVGSTGNSTGPHLHFEIRLNGTPVDPAPLVASTRP
ncbi:MAG: peptidoglycan DD-metalloendopeptidase family protein [Oscillospiraceae bacterium]|nr:peptidoglycan DD-metalloendopeptidase family protein [Oscillospiraceae bacterium]